MIRWPVAFAVLVLCLASSQAYGQSLVPETALAAEAAGQWQEAGRVYRAALVSNPRQADLWRRLADVEARQGNIGACIDALEHAVELTPTSSLYARLSQAHAVAQQPELALAAIEAALDLGPSSSDHLQARATLATWTADYGRAQDSYRRLVRIRPNDLDLALAYARVSAWGGDTNQAVSSYRRYLKATPAAPEVWIELAKAESWRGNYAGAMEALGTYRERFGESLDYSNEVATVLAYGDRPNQAQEVLRPLLGQTPDSYNLNLTRAVASAMQRRSRDAFASLETVKRLAPESRDTRNAERMLRTLLGSTVEPRFNVYSDSDRLEVVRFAPQATVSFATGTQFSTGYERVRLRARHGTGLDAFDGSLSADYEQTWVGGAQKLGRVVLKGAFGYATGGIEDMSTYSVSAETRAADSLRFSIERSSGFFVVSPRTVGLGLTQHGHRAQIDWSPTLRSRIVLDASHQELSDGNRRLEVTFSPRRTFARRAGFNLDLGFSAYRLETDFDVDHGYYDPHRYEQYAAVMYPYFKISEGVGLGLVTALGVQRDQQSSSSFRLGGTASGEATFGIYDPWVLKVNASATRNRRLESGAFQGFSGGVVLVRRF